MSLLQLLRQEVADVAAANDDDPARLRFLVPEHGHAARHVLSVDREIDFVTDEHLVVAARHDEPRIPADRKHHDVEFGKELGELAERRVDDGTAFLAAHRNHAQTPAAEWQHVEGARHL